MSQTIEHRMADAVLDELQRFAEWCAKEWSLTKELAANDPEMRALGADYLKGYNAALKGLPLALESYREEVAP